MKVTVLGASGRTGRLLTEELTHRGHDVTVVVRDPATSPQSVVVVGDVRDHSVLERATVGADAVVSTLGPSGTDADLHGTMVSLLVPAMRAAGVRRYVGVGGAGVDVPGDRKRLRDRLISRSMQLFAGSMVRDKTTELAVWQDTDLDWTFVRPPRLVDGPATGRVEHDPHVSTRSTRMRRADLAVFLADVVEQDLYRMQAPFAATRG